MRSSTRCSSSGRAPRAFVFLIALIGAAGVALVMIRDAQKAAVENEKKAIAARDQIIEETKQKDAAVKAQLAAQEEAARKAEAAATAEKEAAVKAQEAAEAAQQAAKATQVAAHAQASEAE